MDVCIVQPCATQVSETFLRAHAERLPGNITVLHGKRARIANGRISLAEHISRSPLAIERLVRGQSKTWEYTESYVRRFRHLRPQAVIAEYGVTGVHVMDACRAVDVPLIVHFRGFDASQGTVLEQHRDSYPRLFEQAAAIIAVARSIEQKLISLGADAAKIHYNPSGADCSRFVVGDPAAAPPVLLAVGRMADTKSPHLTILAFFEVYRRCPEARLRIVGEGPMRGFCEQLVEHLRLQHAVTFLGAQPHDLVQTEMRRARAFVQHSTVTPTGDAEGTPVAIQEAGASGLPVISTRHAGIVDVVTDGETGFLVDEWDVHGMAQGMLRVVQDRALAGRLGQAARQRVAAHFSQEGSLRRLWSIVQACVAQHGTAATERQAA